MRRDESLQPLSREHLGALLAVKRMRDADGPGAAREVFLGFWETDGRHHFRIEEEVLLPEWARFGQLDSGGVERMLAEHLAIRREALRLRDGELSMEEVRELAKALEDHVRFEERDLFPMIEGALDGEALGRLGKAVELAEKSI